MGRVRLAFYKASGGLGDKIIRWWTAKEFSHVELVFPPNGPEFIVPTGTAFSASVVDQGVRFKEIDFKPENWTFVDVVPALSFDERISLWEWCAKRVVENRGYALLDLVKFVLPAWPQDWRQYFCSEVCIAALQHVGRFPNIDPSGMSPGELWEIASCLEATWNQKEGA